ATPRAGREPGHPGDPLAAWRTAPTPGDRLRRRDRGSHRARRRQAAAQGLRLDPGERRLQRQRHLRRRRQSDSPDRRRRRGRGLAALVQERSRRPPGQTRRRNFGSRSMTDSASRPAAAVHVADGVTIAIQRLPHADGLALPTYATAQSAGLDLPAAVEAPLTLQPGAWQAVPTGFAIALPPGTEAQVRPRSGLAL